MEIKGFITNLGKYNEGELIGKWITFPISDDDLQAVLKKINCCYYDEDGEYINTGYEEFFFTDWETDFCNTFGEYEQIEDINEFAEKLEEWDEDTFNAVCEIWGSDIALNGDNDDYILYSDINSCYDLGYYWIEESGCYDTSSLGSLSNYIDYEGFGRDISYEANGGFSAYGWVEYVG